MMRPNHNERLNAAVAAAAERLRAAEQRAAERTGAAAPGDVYALLGLGQDDLAWLVTHYHPDQDNQRFLVPLDDNPLCGTPDVPLADAVMARCGEGVWVPAGLLPDARRVDVLDEHALRLVRAGIAALASGELIHDPDRQAADDDPNYQRWMRRVESSRRKLERRAEAAGMVFSFQLFRAAPPAWGGEPITALAARTGGLSQQMDAADREADARVRHQVLSWSGGTLRLAANEHGLLLAWEGSEQVRPAVLVRGQDRQLHEVAWQPSNPSGPQVTPLLPWIEGRIVLRVGGETLTILR